MEKYGWLAAPAGLSKQAIREAVANVIADYYEEREVSPETLAIPVIPGFRGQEEDDE